MKSAILLLLFGCQSVVYSEPSPDTKENYKDQYCTDPRTLQKHVAYSEWADAYSCTRHRCQPGGRNLAIYTVGCKRVEAPESAIECEEVVEDTNMQFPFCCTRLRCLVVVRGEVWTRVLGQPWETLPAAPWSHMYKMKKPPPSDTGLLPKTPDNQGPVYELADPDNEGGRDKVLRSGKKPTTECPDCNDIVPRAAPPPPDIVIALSTGSEQLKDPVNKKLSGRRIAPRHKRGRKSPNPKQYFEEDQEPHSKAHEPRHGDQEPHETRHEPHESRHEPHESRHGDQELHEPEVNEPEEPSATDKNEQLQMWTELPRNHWNEPAPDTDNKDGAYNTPADNQSPEPERKVGRPPNLQALVDAIGTRMRDIESVVLRMSEKVHRVKPAIDFVSSEKRAPAEPDTHQKSEAKELQESQKKRPSPDTEHYKRFSVRNRSKYLHGVEDGTTEPPLFAEETNGYYSDASNSVLRRASSPKEPMAPLYMAPVDTRRSGPHAAGTDVSEDDKKHKRHGHKKRKSKTGHSHKKRHKDDKKKHFAKFNSVEVDRNVVSLEDSSAIASS